MTLTLCPRGRLLVTGLLLLLAAGLETSVVTSAETGTETSAETSAVTGADDQCAVIGPDQTVTKDGLLYEVNKDCPIYWKNGHSI